MINVELVKLIAVILFSARVVFRVMHVEGTETLQIIGAIAGVIFFFILGLESWNKRKVKTD